MKYMFKKLLFSLLAVLMIYSSAAMVYRIFEPQLDTNEQKDLTYVDYATLSDYILSHGEASIHVVFFCSLQDANSLYVKDTVLSTVQSDTGLPVSQIIEVVDVSTAGSDIEARLQRDWGVGAIPSFVSVGVENGQCVVHDRLEWREEDPLKALRIEEWLEANGFRTRGTNY